MPDTKGMTLKDIEKAAIIQAIKECSGSLSTAASKLDIGRSTLYRKLKEYEIDVASLIHRHVKISNPDCWLK